LKLECRDCFIGWSSEQRKRFLAHVLNNDRFLILEDVRVKNLASHLLARTVRMVRRDWEKRYGVAPYVLESFADPRFFSGACYRAAGWRWVGWTKGYEKIYGGYRYHGQRKEVYVYVVEPGFRTIIGCKERSCPQGRSKRQSRRTEREGKLRMMIGEVGYDPQLIDWAGIGEETIGGLAEQIGEADGMLGVDSSEIAKKGTESVGVAGW